MVGSETGRCLLACIKDRPDSLREWVQRPIISVEGNLSAMSLKFHQHRCQATVGYILTTPMFPFQYRRRAHASGGLWARGKVCRRRSKGKDDVLYTHCQPDQKELRS